MTAEIEGLGQMLPCGAVDHIIQRVDGDAVLAGENVSALTGCAATTNLDDLIFGQSGGLVLLTAQTRLPIHTVGFTSRMPTLRDHIGVIIPQGAQEQVIGADTGAVVTTVQDIQSRWDLSEVQAPRDAVHAVAGESAIRLSYLDMTVAGALADAAGFPAAISLDDSSPEPRCQVLLDETACGIMIVHQITPGAAPSAVDAARGLLDEILP